MESRKGIFTEHLAKWKDKKNPGEGRLFTRTVSSKQEPEEQHPELSSQLKKQIVEDAEELKMALFVKGNIFETNVHTVNEVLESIFNRINQDLEADWQWRPQSQPSEARLDIFKSYIFAVQAKVIESKYGSTAGIATAPEDEKNQIKKLIQQTEDYYNNTYNKNHPVGPGRGRSPSVS